MLHQGWANDDLLEWVRAQLWSVVCEDRYRYFTYEMVTDYEEYIGSSSFGRKSHCRLYGPVTRMREHLTESTACKKCKTKARMLRTTPVETVTTIVLCCGEEMVARACESLAIKAWKPQANGQMKHAANGDVECHKRQRNRPPLGKGRRALSKNVESYDVE